MKLRGPGDFFGSRQHGLPALKIADFIWRIGEGKIKSQKIERAKKTGER